MLGFHKMAREPEGEMDAKPLLKATAFKPGVVSLTLACLFLPVLRQQERRLGRPCTLPRGSQPFQHPSVWVWGGEWRRDLPAPPALCSSLCHPPAGFSRSLAQEAHIPKATHSHLSTKEPGPWLLGLPTGCWEREGGEGGRRGRL